VLALLLCSVAEYTGAASPEAWRRYLMLVLDGLRAGPGEPSPLPVDALSEEQADEAMRAWRPPRR
jgi:hypothetical protein